jgi:hypothetical protein
VAPAAPQPRVTPDPGPAAVDTTPTIWLPDAAARADLATFAGRARRVDAGGAVRLVAHGNVLAVTACALHGASGPTVLAMRTLVLADASEVDATVPVAALADRLARDEAAGPESERTSDPQGGRCAVPLPPGAAVTAAWAGLLPPRRGWERTGAVPAAVLAAAAREGIAAVAAGTTPGAGAAAVTRLRAGVWGRPLAGVPGVPTGVAFATDAFGFLGDGTGEATLHRAGAWVRLSTPRGHVLSRPPLSLVG